jgi:hypothetical protein
MILLTSDRPTSETLQADFTELVADLFECNGGIRSLAMLNTFDLPGEATNVADAVAKWVVRDGSNQNAAVILCASPVAPELVARGIRRAREAKATLGSELGRVILEPLREGELHGLSYAVLPFCQPLSKRRLVGRVQRLLLCPAILQWLRRLTEATSREVDAPEREHGFQAPLRHLIENASMTATLREVARVALERLQTRQWSPRHVLMHNDFWIGNILIDQRNVTGRQGLAWRERFVVIDWPGSTIRGYGFFDLVRFARATGLSRSRLKAEVAEHCRILKCELSDAKCHMTAALGYLEMHRERFPLEHFKRMADACLETLRAVCGDQRR